MEQAYIEAQSFEKRDFAADLLPKGEYEKCHFSNCSFAGTDLSGYSFSDCTFSGCNFSLAKTGNTAFREVKFKDCKLLGLRFDRCNDFLFAVSFENCQLNLSSFFRKNLKKATFRNSSLQEADFTEADLSSAVFDHCEMSRAIFSQSILEKADFRTSFNYSIDPERNRMKKAKFALQGLNGLLDKYDIEIE